MSMFVEYTGETRTRGRGGASKVTKALIEAMTASANKDSAILAIPGTSEKDYKLWASRIHAQAPKLGMRASIRLTEDGEVAFSTAYREDEPNNEPETPEEETVLFKAAAEPVKIAPARARRTTRK